jgi:hypothetical protein
MTRARRVWLSLGFGALLLAGGASFAPQMLWGDHADYSQVVSIKTSREYQDPALLAKAWALPVASLYRTELDYQQNGSFCGPTSLVNVLRSLRAPADQSSILEGTGVTTIGGLLPGGLTLDKLGEIAQKKLAKRVTILRDLDLAAFREQLRQSNDPARRYVINFTRGPLFATGGGHFSPIAGYLVDEDLVFVLDVNKKYGPWLVKSERLLQAMNTLDASAKKKRGLLLIE